MIAYLIFKWLRRSYNFSTDFLMKINFIEFSYDGVKILPPFILILSGECCIL